MSFEESLLNGIPLDEAAGFFMRVRGKDKAATAMPGANGAQAMAALPATAKGQQMPAPQMPALPPTAMGQNTSPGMKMASDKSPEETGRERARASLSAEFEKEKAHRGEARGGLAGGALGAVGGGLAAHRYGKGNPLATIAGAALGHHMGKGLGRDVGAGQDAHRHEKNANAFTEGMAFIPEMIRATVGEVAKNTQGDRVKGLGLLTAGAIPLAAMAGAGFAMGRFTGKPASLDKAASAFKLALQETPGLAPMAPQGIEPALDPETAQMLALQQEGDQAAQQGESSYLRQQLESLRQESAAALQEAETLKSQQAQADATTAQMQAQVADATQKAMDSQDQVLQQQQAAAAMRMAFQELRGQMLEAASAEPPSLTPSIGSQAAAAQASQAAGASSAPSPTAGPAGQAPNPGVPPAGMAPTGDDTVSTPAEKNEPMFEGASPTTQVGQKEPSGDAKTPNKEVLASASRPLVRP
jgi:hypothetical protein